MHYGLVVVITCGLGLTGCVQRSIGSRDASAGSGADGLPANTDEGADMEGAELDDSSGPVPQACGSSSSEAIAQCVDPGSLEQDIRFIADIRTPGSAHWLAVQSLCADRLTMLGYEVELQEYGTGVNVLGVRPGTTRADEVILVGAHYDHIPGCIGADDNATGVGAVLEVARLLASVPTARTLGIACWDEEEVGLIGSISFIQLLSEAPRRIATYFNYDMIGIRRTEPGTQQMVDGLELLFPEQYAQVAANEFRGDFIALLADDLALDSVASFETHARARGLGVLPLVLDRDLKNSPLVLDFRRSDHAPFWFVDIPALFMTDTAELRHPNYHCIGAEDTADSLDFAFAADVVGASAGAVADALEVVP